MFNTDKTKSIYVYGLKQGDALSPLLFNFALGYAIKKVQKTMCDWNSMERISCWSTLMM
jgi:hypothetical protein